MISVRRIKSIWNTSALFEKKKILLVLGGREGLGLYKILCDNRV